MRTCFFIGQANVPDSLRKELNNAVDYLVRKNQITEFVVSNRGNFDRMAIAAVQEAIRCYPDKALTAYLLEPNPYACIPERLPAMFAYFYCPPEALFVSEGYRNEKAAMCILEQTDVLLACCPSPVGTTLRLFHRAKKLQRLGLLTIWNLQK